MKRLVLILVFALMITGCSKSADIHWERSKIIIDEIAFIPSEVGARDTHLITYTVKGEPVARLSGYDTVTLIDIYTKDGTRCSSVNPISGGEKDVAVLGKIQVIGSFGCYSKDNSKLRLVFRESTSIGLDAIGEKLDIKVSKTPSKKSLKVLVELIEKSKQRAQEAEEKAAKAKIEQELKEEKINERYEEFSKAFLECMDTTDKHEDDCISDVSKELCGDGFCAYISTNLYRELWSETKFNRIKAKLNHTANP